MRSSREMIQPVTALGPYASALTWPWFGFCPGFGLSNQPPVICPCATRDKATRQTSTTQIRREVLREFTWVTIRGEMCWLARAEPRFETWGLLQKLLTNGPRSRMSSLGVSRGGGNKKRYQGSPDVARKAYESERVPE